jgi:hypothetical protein
MAGPAELVTRLRPWAALLEASEAASLVASAAFWVVVDWKRRALKRAEDRSRGRAATADMLMGEVEGKGMDRLARCRGRSIESSKGTFRDGDCAGKLRAMVSELRLAAN